MGRAKSNDRGRFSVILIRIGRPIFSRTKSPLGVGKETSRTKRTGTHERDCVGVFVSILIIENE